MLNFTKQLKELIHDVEINGGNSSQKISPPSELVHHLKAHAISQLRKYEPLNRNVEYFLEEFKNGFFEEAICACLSQLMEMGITNLEEVQRILKKVVERELATILNEYDWQPRVTNSIDRNTLDDAFVETLLSVWQDCSSTGLYTIAEQRFLILWDYQRNCWQITGLGKFILGLKPVQVIIFLLTIDLILSTSNYDLRYISASTLIELIDKTYSDYHLGSQGNILKRFGILKDLSQERIPNAEQLTPLGKAVIKTVLSEDNPMQEIVDILVEDEKQGINFKGADKELEYLQEKLVHGIFD